MHMRSTNGDALFKSERDIRRIPLAARICSSHKVEHMYKNGFIGYRKSMGTYKFEYYMDRLYTRAGEDREEQ